MRDAASSISTFLTLAVTDLLITGKFILPTPANTFSFLLWSNQHIIMLYNNWKLSFCTAEGILTSAECCFASHACSTSHSAKSSATLRMQIFHIWMHWLTKSAYLELSSVFL